jgi:hypothetical protein
MALVLTLAGCGAAPVQAPPGVLTLSVNGWPVCAAARITPTIAVTAKHCTEQGWRLHVNGAPTDVLWRAADRDVAWIRVPTPRYRGESTVLVRGRVLGDRRLAVLHSGPTWLELDGPCARGESGSPVYTAAGQVATVTQGDAHSCIAESTPDP